MKLQITIEGRAYEVDVELVEEEEEPPVHYASFPAPILAAHAPGFGASGGDPHICRSPVTGLVVKVNVTAGQVVEADELMLVLEAMKMETNVTAPRAATVKAVHVAPGGPVKLNQPLVEFE